MTHVQRPCPCGSGDKYEQCCGRFHQGASPENALQLMRSRYTAYVYDMPDYIIKTTHPASPHYVENKAFWKKDLSEFAKSVSFRRLEIVDFRENETIATVAFVTYLGQDNQEIAYTEQSFFEKANGQWYYLRGKISKGRVIPENTQKTLQVLPIAYYGEPILRVKAPQLSNITDETRFLVEQMIETMEAFSGIGLAAPQIHRSERIFITKAPIEGADGKLSPGQIEVFINPILSSPSSSTCDIEEGCLSIPTSRSMVRRPKEINIEYTTLEGEVVKRRLIEWEARTAMHENDHINGVLFFDRLGSKEKKALDIRLENLKNRLQFD
jgi:peptide deformylase